MSDLSAEGAEKLESGQESPETTYKAEVQQDLSSNNGPSKLAPDGRTELVPQPTDSKLDPLNWSWAKKHSILFILSATAFIPDYGSATGAPLQLPQAPYWGISEATVGHSLAGSTFSLAGGGLIAVMLSTYFGRLPVLLWLTVIAFATAAWCAGAPSFNSFMAARIFNSLFDSAALVSGLIYIQDMFFFHQHARKINIWSSFFVLAPYLGPQLAAFMITSLSWRWPFWIYTIMTGLCVVAICLFVDESYFDRTLPPDQQPPRKSHLLRLIGVEQWQSRKQRVSFFQAVLRSFRAILKIPVFFTTLHYTVIFAWSVGINNSLSIYLTELYDFKPKNIGFFYFTPMVAVLLGELIGHRLHDFIADLYAKHHGGHLVPEARLIVLWIALPCQVAGLVLFGYCYQDSYHYMISALAWGLYIFGVMVSTVGLNAYLLDSYPEGAGEVAAWLNVARAIGGGAVTYFQTTWVLSSGAIQCFGIEAAICAASMLLFIVSLQVFGQRLRRWGGSIER